MSHFIRLLLLGRSRNGKKIQTKVSKNAILRILSTAILTAVRCQNFNLTSSICYDVDVLDRRLLIKKTRKSQKFWGTDYFHTLSN